MGVWFPIHAASIYSMLRPLRKEGLVREGTTDRGSARPLRTPHAITKAGREELRRLLRRAWTELPAPGDAFHVALMSTAELDPDELASLLAARRTALVGRLAALEHDARALPSAGLASLERVRAQAEARWLDGLSSRDLAPVSKPRGGGH